LSGSRNIGRGHAGIRLRRTPLLQHLLTGFRQFDRCIGKVAVSGHHRIVHILLDSGFQRLFAFGQRRVSAVVVIAGRRAERQHERRCGIKQIRKDCFHDFNLLVDYT